jgi:hypothetical protein
MDQLMPICPVPTKKHIKEVYTCDEVTACCLEFVETVSALSAIEPVKACTVNSV